MRAPTFELYEYNPRRRARGAEAARVLVTYDDGEQDLLWMSKGDVQKNLDHFGESVGLREALAAYAMNCAPSDQNSEPSGGTSAAAPGSQNGDSL